MAHPNSSDIGLSVSRYAGTDGIGFSVLLSLRPDVARQIADAMRDAAEKLCDATDLPPNARIADDSAGSDAVATADATF